MVRRPEGSGHCGEAFADDVDPQTYIPGTDLGEDAGGSSPQSLKAAAAHQRIAAADLGRITDPARIEGPEPNHPKAKVGTSVTVTVQVLVGEDGLPYEPRILDLTGEYTLAFSALDVMASWRFRPAMLDGEAIPVLYQVLVHYVSRG